MIRLEDFDFNPITDEQLENNRWDYIFSSSNIHYCNGRGKHSILLVFTPDIKGNYSWYEVSRDGNEFDIKLTMAIVNKLQELNNKAIDKKIEVINNRLTLLDMELEKHCFDDEKSTKITLKMTQLFRKIKRLRDEKT